MAILFILFIILILIICFIIYNTLKVHYYNSDSFFDIKHGGSNIKQHDIKQLKLYFTISGECNGLDFSQLRQLFKDGSDKYGISFIEVPVSESAHISFGTFGKFIIKGHEKRWNYDPLFFKQNTAIKNTLGEHHQLINKSELYDTIKKLIPNGIKYLPKTYTISDIPSDKTTNIPSDQYIFDNIKFPIIIKKDNFVQQQAVIIASSKEEYKKAKETLYNLEIKRASIKKVKPSYEISISEYISNPLLLDSKKMHFRVYYLLSIISGIIRCTVHDEYRIHLAEKEYKKGDWLNPDIHISGAICHTKNRPYYWPDDISGQYDINLIKEKMAEFNKVICMAMTISNTKNYSESYAGYHLYGADVMLTDDFQVYLLEINHKPGFNFNKHEKGWEEASKKFSYKLFSFILDSTVLPFFGIVKPPIYEGEFISNGALTPFANLLIGANKCYLIPYVNATQKELEMVKNIYFFSHSILFNNLIKDANSNDIFLIAYMTNLVSVIIGYIVLDKENFLQIAITKEYQNRGIATAMIAQLIEIYFARYITQKHFIIYIKSGSNDFINNIAKKLKFTINKNSIYEKDCKLHNNIIINKILNHKLLTYKIVTDVTNKINFHLNSDIFILSDAQFVHFSYNISSSNIYYKKNSTGSKYDSNFIYQGAELKSSLDIKILFGNYTFKRWYYQHFNDSIAHIFDSYRIKSINEIDNNKKYSIYNYTTNNKHLINEQLNSSHFNDNNLIEEYNIPYLIDNKLLCIRFYLVIYISKNVIKIFCFDRHYIITPNENFLTSDLNNNDRIIANSENLVNITDDKILKNLNVDNIINNIFIPFLKILLKYDIKPYPESNTGFYELSIDLKFIDYLPKIHRFNIILNNKIDDYYQWLSNCIILPHFGCQTIDVIKSSNKYTPIYGISNCEKIKYEIIKNLFLEFNKERTYIKIYYKTDNDNYNIIGHIKLNIKMANNIIMMDHIEIDKHHRKKNISIHVIYLLMNLLGAYYAPAQIQLSFLYIKQMHTIAFELDFLKQNNYYIRKCR